tara:strand:- start:232 stop:726 length:495 start_codon:yes stop_codon:yes gene_type:complete
MKELNRMRTTIIFIIMIVLASLLMWKAKKDPIVFESKSNTNQQSLACNEQVCLELRNLNVANRSFEIHMTNSVPVFGFQCDLPGLEITGASGGLLEEYDYQTSNSKNRVLSFSMQAIPIPVGSGSLVRINYNNPTNSVCMTEIIFAGIGGGRLTNNIPECMSLN